MQLTENHQNQVNTSHETVTSFLSCLKNIESRISSKKVTSKSNEPKPISASIDKLHLSFNEPKHKHHFLEHLCQNGFTVKYDWLNGRKTFIRAEKGSGPIYFPDSEIISKCTTNPSKFQNWQLFKTNIHSILNSSENTDYKITRLDLALDYSSEFNKIKNELYVSRIGSLNKFNIESFESSKSSGVRYGKKPRQIEVYDYSLKHSKDEKITRIEERLFNKKIFIQKLEDLEQIDKFPIFQNTSLAQRTVPIPVASLNEKTKNLHILIDQIGFFETRKTLNEQSNFKRDYEKFLSIKPYKETPEQAFKRLIKPYFNHKEEK